MDELFEAGKIPSGGDEHSISEESDSEKNIWNSTHVITRRAAFYSKIEQNYKEGTYTDVNIVCDDWTFRCHRLALVAASEYFRKFFAENPLEQNVDLCNVNIDRNVFEQILVYVYRGEIVAIHDENVFSLLLASDHLKLSDMEVHCVHYLTQRNIPMNYALEILVHAIESDLFSLIPAVCKFILEHLDCFRKERFFLALPLEVYSTLLEYFQPSSASRERRLLDVIFKRVCKETRVHEERWSYFTELAEKVQFRTFSPLCIAKYFKRNSVDSNEESRRIRAADFDSEKMLHVYIRTVDRRTTSYNTNDDTSTLGQSSIFSLEEDGGECVDWHHCCTIAPPIQKMRIVESYGRLYFLKLIMDQWTFSSSTAIDFSADVQPLAPPSGILSINPSDFAECHYDRSKRKLFSLCHLRKKIYLSGLHENVGFQCYDTELDVWSRISGLRKHEPKNMISDDTRLYMIHEPPFSRLFYFSAYDPREGKLIKLSNEGLKYFDWCDEPCSYHKGKIYVPEYDVDYSTDEFTLKMAVYDPIPGRWEVQKSKFHDEWRTEGHRIVPLNNRLWMLGWKDTVFTKTYDSYLQSWSKMEADRLYDELVDLKLHPTDFLDAVVF